MLNKIQIQICLGSSCFSRGNHELVEIIKKYIKKNHLEDSISFSGSHCSNLCVQGPNIRIAGKVIHNISKENIEEILNTNIKV